MTSPLNTNLWLAELNGDEDEAFLTDGISNGLKLAPPNSNVTPVQQDNYKSVTNAVSKAAVEQTILEEIAEGNYIITDSKPIIINALGTIPKPDSSVVHLIHDCSRPTGRGLHSAAIL